MDKFEAVSHTLTTGR